MWARFRVETGGCPHTAIREDASINLAAIADLNAAFPDLDLVLIESGGDNLAATFSPELADLTIYVIDTAAGQDIPRKRGPGLARSDLLVVNKIDLAPHVGVGDAQFAAADPSGNPVCRVVAGDQPARGAILAQRPEGTFRRGMVIFHGAACLGRNVPGRQLPRACVCGIDSAKRGRGA